MKEKLAKLVDVKSIVTLLMTFTFCSLSAAGKVSVEFMTIYTVIIGFYFGTQSGKQTRAGSEAPGKE